MDRLTAEQAREWLDYNPTTGALTWRVTRSRLAQAGDPAGHLKKSGYVQVIIRGKAYAAHRLAWLITHGSWPENDIDHCNGVGFDNRIVNLRDVTTRVNTENRRIAATTSKTGLLGVSPRADGQFLAQIQVNGKKRHLGLFPTAEQGHAAYLDAKRKFHIGATI